MNQNSNFRGSLRESDPRAVGMTHHVSILEMNGDSYRLAQSRARKSPQAE
jgi:hypothetical protein